MNIKCVICNRKCKIENDKIYMKCMCDEEKRVFNLINFKLNSDVFIEYIYIDNSTSKLEVI